MAYTKDSFSKKQFLARLKLCFPTAQLLKAVASSGTATRERDWPRWLLIWTLIATFFRAGDGLLMIARWLKSVLSRGKVPSEEALYQARQRLGRKPFH
jgi:hypothetical protein